MATIKFLPFGTSVETDGTKDLLELAQGAKIPIQSTCGGKGKCGKCAVIIRESDIPLSPPSAREKTALGGSVQNNYRLACETRLAQGAVG